MQNPLHTKGKTRTSLVINASRPVVYHACVDPGMIVLWRVPNSMTGHVHEFDPRVGGRFRMTLTYHDRAHSLRGKSSENEDTCQGRFLELVPNEKIVELVEFESEDPAFAGEMKITTSFVDVGVNTEITILCEDIPAGIKPADNEQGCMESLQKLALLLN
jgi:uncharacterized protein YndB with AHSA1/START domain